MHAWLHPSAEEPAMSLIKILRKGVRFLTPSFVAPLTSVAQESPRLAAGQSIRFDDACGRTVHCLAGSLWITHDGDPKDVIVEAGESYQVASRERMIVHALRESALRSTA
jgi:uncharacterized protein YaiE (UPF0345 family)